MTPDAMQQTTFERPQNNRHAEFWKSVLVVLPFLLLYWVDIAHHTMFFDEVNAWAISAASPNLKVLLHYVHFEGHPWLWYFILWLPAKLTHDPVGMKWVVTAIGTASILVLGFLSPFTRLQRLLLLASYFVVWEYTVMCRMYGVMLLCALLYAARRARKPEGLIGSCVLLGIMASTDMSGTILSGTLLLEYFYSSYHSGSLKAQNRRWLLALAVYVAFVAFAVISLWPSREISWQSSGTVGSAFLDGFRWLQAFGDMVVGPWWPISSAFPHHFWEEEVEPLGWLFALLPVILWAYWKTFEKRKNFVLLMSATLFIGICFADLVYRGKVRHWGIAFVALVVGLWLYDAEHRQATGSTRAWSPWTYGLFTMSALAGVLAVTGSWMHPFSRARDTAEWLRANEPANVALAGGMDVSFGSVAEELQRPVYFMECDCFDTFKLFSKYRETYDEREIPFRVERAFASLHTQKIVFVIYRPLTAGELTRLRTENVSATQVASFPGADSTFESYFVYELRHETA